MGIAGSGKSTVAPLLASGLDARFAEGDAFHTPASVEKMAGGTPLDDDDRRPWLLAVAHWLGSQAGGAVVSCSALKRSYRDLLREGLPDLFFVHLDGDPELLRSRVQQRADHFMPASLVDSQLAALDPLEPDEAGLTLDIAAPVDQLVRAGVDAVRRHVSATTLGCADVVSTLGGNVARHHR
jgi:gluconokinase